MRKYIRPTANWNKSARPFLLLAACCAPAASLLGQAPELVPLRPSETRPLLDNPASAWGHDYTNWIEVGGGGLLVDGDKANVQSRLQLPARAFGGLNSFHWETPINKDWMLQTDARGILSNDDYDVKIGAVNPKQGFLRIGYREFRTWYERTGGYNSIGPAWVTPFDPQVHVDRTDAFIEAGLTVPNAPKITFSYNHLTRDGTKDSTSWGDFNLTPGAAAANIRSIVPSFWDLTERRDIFRADVSHAIGNTGFDLAMRYETSSQNDELNILRRPGELPPLVTPGAQRTVTQEENADTDLFNLHASTQTRINEKVLFTTGFAFTRINTETSGSRLYGPDFDPIFDLAGYGAFPRRQAFDEGFFDQTGNTRLKQYVANLNLLVTPCDNIYILPAVRIDKWDESGESRHADYSIDLPPTLAVVGPDLFEDRNDYTFLDVSESLEARYTGLRNWSFYARGDWTEGNGHLEEWRNTVATGEIDILRDRQADNFSQKYSVGANWYPWQRLNFAVQYYHKIRDNHYEHNPDQAETDLIDRQTFDTDDVNFRVNWRPFNNLTFITRYDFQYSTIDSTTPRFDGIAPPVNVLPGGELQTAAITSHIISESVAWSPCSKLYLQGSFSYAIDKTDTAADSFPVTTASGVVSPLLFESKNGYWNISGMLGYALSERTDLQFQYTYYRANDYDNVSAITQPYDSGAEEHGVTATLMHQFSRALRWTLKYGFFTSHDSLYGSRTDYGAHLVYSTIQYRF